MADSSVGDSSTSENGKGQCESYDTKSNEGDGDNCENEKNVMRNHQAADNSENIESQNTSTSGNLSASPVITVTSATASILRSEGSRMNNSSSPIRPSILAGGCASSSTSSLFGSTPICSPMSAFSNSFPRNLFTKSNVSCSRTTDNRSPVFQKLVLRPSQLASPSVSDSPSTSKSPNPFTLNPPKLANPFTKVTESSGDEPSKPSSSGDSSSVEEVKTTISSSKIEDSNIVVAPTAAGQQGSPPQQPLQQSCNKTPTSSVAFVPLTTPGGSATSSTPIRLPTSSNTPAVTPTSATPGGFVFGQNLHERVLVEQSGSEAGPSSSSDPQSASVVLIDAIVTSTASANAATNGTSTEMLFTSVIQKELPEKPIEGNGNTDDKGKKSLTESAREYEESRAVKRKYEEVAVVTGEEEENNILQMDCKLFVYDGSKFNYSEGVHGSLRVNDPPVTAKKVTQSRVIVRMSGTLRVLMNTKIWAGMKIEKPNRKIVRMTAMDNLGQIKVFLISSSPSEIDMLYRVLESRIKLQKELTGACRNGSVDDTDIAGSSQ